MTEDDETVLFAPIEVGMATGTFFDSSAKSRIVAKPITRYNPIQDVKVIIQILFICRHQ